MFAAGHERGCLAGRPDGRLGRAAVLSARQSPGQPWPVLAGNIVSGLVGVTCALHIDSLLLAGPLAGSLAIAAMFSLRCLHPPGGAVALTAVLAGPAVVEMGYRFVMLPVAVNSACTVAGAILYNNLTGRRYPHGQQAQGHHPHGTDDPAPGARLGFTSADLDAVLARYGQVLDVSRDDLEDIIVATESQAYSVLAGVPGEAGSADGTGGAARLNAPQKMTIDASGNVYVIDGGNATIRKITPGGVVTTVAGTAQRSTLAYGKLPSTLPTMYGIAAAGSVLYATTDDGVLKIRLP